MEKKNVKKTAGFVNSVILLLVFGLMWFFHICKVTFMIWFSIPTALVYIIGYVLIHRNKLAFYTRMVYFWLTLYMSCSTVCLGYGYGFHLYCFSMIPILFATEYISFKLQERRLRAVPISIGIAAMYLASTGYTALFGPVYQRDQRISAFFWIFNAICVFGFLIYYTRYLIRNVIRSEEKLIEIAHIDQLTKLYNRHYMLSYLESLPDSVCCIAIADIDDFKKINDTYGHNAGDAVLKAVADTMRKECTGCTIARWGGEEFLIYSDADTAAARDRLNRMREIIEGSPIQFETHSIRVTLTIGIAARTAAQSIDSWIHTADSKLYYGKNNGKNQVVL